MIKNMKIGTRLAAGFAIVVVLLLIVAGLSIVRINSIDDIVDTFVDVDMPKVQ